MTIGRVIHFKVKISLSLFIITSREHYTTLYQVELGKSSCKNLLGADFVSIQKSRGYFFVDFNPYLLHAEITKRMAYLYYRS